MHLSEILIPELDAFAAKVGKKKLDIVETGSIRGDEGLYHPNDGWSTVTLAEYVKKNGGTFNSIDLDTSTAKRVLKDQKLDAKVTFNEGHSVDVLSGFLANAYAGAKKVAGEVQLGGAGFLDVAFLDSANDGELILAEYLVVRRLLRSPGLVIVDDVDLDSDGVQKGHRIVPWVKDAGIEYRIIRRDGIDYSTGVLVFEV